MQKIPDYLASINYRNPGDFENDLSLFSFANQTKLGHWEWLQAHPDLLKVFNERMALTIEVESKESQLDTNPLNVVMKEVARDASPQDVVLVDVGGGHGQVLSHIRTALPDLKGRMVLEDLEETLMGHARQTDVEVVLYDFFTPQPVIGARAYIFRHILHDWPDQKCREILLKTIPALAGSYSRVLIAEIVLPDVYNSQTPKKGTMMDLVMMRVAGKERTESQWRELLGSVGLAVKKVWKGAWQECIIEAVIRTTKEE
ncbi:MAG: hypothetical protein M1827_006392 [Pycnora praestabilis]|nr:MAG: hypothetical protein M1827_006392 [Pycnora praestabilis]